jgi:DNA-binding winged helix-turn-helix (wHTH) protein/Tol biopolymer transport system component
MESNGHHGRVRFGVFELDVESGELRKAGKPVRLQPQPSKVLAALLARPGQIVTREELKHQIWNGTTFVDFEQGLNFCIRQIRVALDDDAEAPRFVETVPRRGYRFIADTTPLQATPAQPETDLHPKKKPRTTLAYSTGIAALVLLIFAYWLLYRASKPRMPEPSTWQQLTYFTDSATSPAISPDGRTLAFVRGPDTFAGPGQIYVKLLPDGQPVQLTHDLLHKMSPVFSPDGSRIAYTIGAKWDTWEVPTMGGEPRLMLANASGLTWKDEHHVLFSEIKTGRHMGLVAATDIRADEHDIYLPQDEAGMAHRSALSPDRRWLLVAEMDSVHGWLPCRLLPADGSTSGKSVGPPGSHCTSATWSPDGRWIYFSSDPGGSFHIWRQRFPDGKPEQVTSGPMEEEGVAFAPDGRSIITSVGIAEGTVWVHDAKGDHQISSEGYAEAPSLSPDGKSLFYLVRLRSRGHLSAGLYPNNADLWAVDLNTRRAEPVLAGFHVTGYSIAPDGKQIACSALDNAGQSHLWIVSVDRAKPPQQIRTETSLSEDIPLFARNGDLFFRASEGPASYLYRLAHGGTSPEKALPEAIVEPQSVSPDGRWVIAQVALNTEKGTTRGVVAYPARGGIPIRLSPTLCFFNWSFDAKFIYVHLLGTSQSNEIGQTFVVPLRSGYPFPKVPDSGIQSEADLLSLPGTRILEGMISPGPDSSRYAFTKQSVHRNIYRIPTP